MHCFGVCILTLHLTLPNFIYGVPGVAITQQTTKNVLLPNCSVPICRGFLSDIYCHGKILALSWHFFGNSSCMASKLRHPPQEVMDNFSKLPLNVTKLQFAQFCKNNFEHVSYLEKAYPVDWVPNPPKFDQIANPQYKDFALKLNLKWKQLGRKVKSDVKENVNLYPVIYVDKMFIVPGGSFSIYYYWDSFWIIKGLLFSGMDITARGILKNFAQLVNISALGHIPNAGLHSLSERSQPPLFTQMTNAYYEEVKDLAFLSEMVPAIEKELAWWASNRSTTVTIRGKTHVLYQYRTMTNCPRPEAYAQDIKDASNSSNKEFVWASITSACESGWDFSSRWFDYEGPKAGTKAGIRTLYIVPVDLNSIMCLNFKILSKFYNLLGNKDKSAEFSDKYNEMKIAVEAVFWDNQSGIWFDYDLDKKTQRFKFYPSNLFPLYSQCFESTVSKLDQIYNYTKNSRAFIYPGGIPASLENTGQQWDLPNAWSPLMHFIIEGMRSSTHEGLQSMAYKLASSWVESGFKGFLSGGNMWEKYDARFANGTRGSGGEYVVQEGFGWTNGVILDLLKTYGHLLGASDDKIQKLTEHEEPKNGTKGVIPALLVLLCICVAVVFVVIYVRRRNRRRFYDGNNGNLVLNEVTELG